MRFDQGGVSASPPPPPPAPKYLIGMYGKHNVWALMVESNHLLYVCMHKAYHWMHWITRNATVFEACSLTLSVNMQNVYSGEVWSRECTVSSISVCPSLLCPSGVDWGKSLVFKRYIISLYWSVTTITTEG